MDIYRPGDDGYAEERAGFQRAREHEAAFVVAATEAEDVRAAVEFAASRGLPVGVQATGHGLANPLAGGVLVSTKRMAGVRIDPGTGTAWIGAGTRWQAVIDEAARYGLAPLSGSAPDVGAVGYTVGGGLGLLARQYGYAADHVSSVELVTADGRLREVAADREPDLFWAVRGGRDNFGIVTRLATKLVPVDRLYGGGLYFAGELAPDVLAGYRAWTADLPEELTSSVGVIPYPDLPMLPEPLRGRRAVHIRVAYTGPAAEGERLVAPLRALGPRLMDTLGELPYRDAGKIYNDPTMPHGYHGDNALLSEWDEKAVGTVLDLAESAVFEVRHLGGALARPPAVPNAVGHRDAGYLLRVISMDGELDAFDAVRPWTLGRALGFTYRVTGPADVREGYDPADYRRLRELKGRYDPDNLFRANHTIS
jgi:FAD/FMN-containing dehydrogenase